MLTGLMAGVLWGLNTVILGIAMAMTPFVSTEKALLLAPFVSTFLHDACSSVWMLVYMGIKGQYRNVLRAMKSRSGKFIILGALLGGPIGMSCYLSAIRYIGSSYTAIISSFYPALGALLSWIFLKERLSGAQAGGLFISILAIIALGYVPGESQGGNLFLGFGCALTGCAAWAAEAVICAYGLKESYITHEHALQIRQLTSVAFYGCVILTFIKGWGFTISVISTPCAGLIAVSALFGTASYVCYYRAISTLGPSRAMALNITYSAWAIVFSALLLHTRPDAKSVVCGIVVVLASLLAANGIEGLKRQK